MTPEQAKEISDKLNEHTAQIVALEIALRSIIPKVEIDESQVFSLTENYPLTGEAKIQDSIRAQVKDKIRGLILRRVQ